jgi:hypothetical protein
VAGAIVSFDASGTQSLDAPCVCHGQPYATIRRRGNGTGWLPATAQVSTDAIRPLLALVLSCASEEQEKLPSTLRQAVVAERILLQRADRWLEELSATLREPALGLVALAALERGTGGLAELAAESSNTLGQALLALTRHAALLNESASFHLHVQGAEAVLVMQYRVSLSRTLRDFFAGYVALSVARWLGSPTESTLWFYGPRPTHVLAYRRALPDVSVTFEAPCDAFVLPASALRTRLRSADPKLHAFLTRAADHVASF